MSALYFDSTYLCTNDRHLLSATPLFHLRGVNVIP